MTVEEFEQVLNSIPAIHRATYLGLFQGYAYHEGYHGKPYRFRLPDEHFQLDPVNYKDFGFNLLHFMVAVAWFDDGSIFYFKLDEDERGNYTDRFLSVACTEDDSWDAIQFQNGMSDWHTAWDWAEALS